MHEVVKIVDVSEVALWKTPFKIVRPGGSLRNERFGGFWGVVQGALKNVDFVKKVKGNLRAASRAELAGWAALAECRGGRQVGWVGMAWKMVVFPM